MAWSATSSAHHSLGALVTWMPCRVASSTSTMSTPVPYRAMTRSCGRLSIAAAPMWAYWVRIASASRPTAITSASDLHWCGLKRNPASSTIARSMFTSPKSESAIMTVPRLVRVTGQSLRGDDVLVGDGEVEAAARVHLAGVFAVELLPRGLVGERRRCVFAPPRGDLLVGEVDVEAMVGHVEGDAIAGTQDREVAADRGFGADVEDGRGIRRAALPAIPEGRDGVDASHDQRGWWLHVDDLRRSGVRDVAGVADHEHAVLVDVQVGVVDAMVVVLGAVEDHGPPG